MNFIINCIKGILLGAGAILPGISSGVICVVFGIYEKLIDSILNFFHDIKNNSLFLLPLVIGGILGVFLFGNFLSFAIEKFPVQTNSLFMGFILGCIPSLIKEIHKDHEFSWKYVPFLIISLCIGVISVFLEKVGLNSDIQSLIGSGGFSTFYLFICGLLMSAGVIVPGVSSTVILMLLGIYPLYLSAVSTICIPILLPLGIGLIIGCLLFMIATKYLLKNFYMPTFYTIIGFTVGSLLILFPTLDSWIDIALFLCCLLLGYIITSSVQKQRKTS